MIGYIVVGVIIVICGIWWLVHRNSKANAEAEMIHAEHEKSEAEAREAEEIQVRAATLRKKLEDQRDKDHAKEVAILEESAAKLAKKIQDRKNFISCQIRWAKPKRTHHTKTERRR